MRSTQLEAKKSSRKKSKKLNDSIKNKWGSRKPNGVG